MARHPLLITVAITVLTAIGTLSASFLAGISLLPASLVGFLAGGLTLSGLQLRDSHHRNGALKESMEELQSQFVYLHERQGQAEAKISDMVKRTIDSPSLALHATATDIDMLGSLVSDLAKTVAEHDNRLSEQAKSLQPGTPPSSFKSAGNPLTVATQTPQTMRSSAMRSSAPQNFEPDAELGFTADFLPALQIQKSAAALDASPLVAARAEQLPTSPAVMAELRETLAKAIADNRLELSLQPIVILPQRKARGYEATLSLKGIRLNEQNGPDLSRIALATGLKVDLDIALLGRATHVSRVLRARKREIAMCCAVSMESLSDRNFRMMIEDLLRNDEKLARSILLEFDDSDVKAAGVEGRTNLFAMSQLGIGIGVSLNDSLRFHAPDLVALGVKQLRVTAAMMQSAAQGSVAADIHPADVAELLQRNGIDLLVSEITDEDMVRDMLDYAAPFAQGDLFGSARVVRPEVLEPKPVIANSRPKEVSQSGAERTAAGANANAAPRNIPRQTFRSLLRRA